MKYIIIYLVAWLCTGFGALGQGQDTSNLPKVHQYWFVLLKTGPNTDADSASKVLLFQNI
ncbi:MAG: hypothetical protein WKI04_17135 [Ferruginibacter sp.]